MLAPLGSVWAMAKMAPDCESHNAVTMPLSDHHAGHAVSASDHDNEMMMDCDGSPDCLDCFHCHVSMALMLKYDIAFQQQPHFVRSPKLSILSIDLSVEDRPPIMR